MKHIGDKSNLVLIVIAYLAFISLGLPDGLLGISWPFLSAKHGIALDSLGILLVSFVAGYLSTSTTTGKIVAIIPLGLLLTISCMVTGMSLLVYAYSNYWFLVIIAAFFLGSGGGAIDTSINIFAASRFSASIVNWLHAFYGIGATAGPFLLTWLLLNNQQWYHGYLIVGIIQIALAGVFLFTLKYWKVQSSKEVQHHAPGSFAEALRLPIVWVSIAIFFLYTGLEVGVGQWIFTVLTKSRGISNEQGGLWTSAYWGSLTAGRIIFGFILTRFEVQKVVLAALAGVVTGALLLLLNQSSWLSLTGIMLIGLANAPIFPSLISITPQQVGVKHAANIIGFQISAAMIGGALLPGLAGLLTTFFGLEVIPFLFFVEAVLLLALYQISSRRKDLAAAKVYTAP